MGFSFLQQSIRDGSLVLWHDYRRWNQNFNDLSGQGNNGTPSNVWFGGKGLQYARNNGAVTVSDAAELQLTTGTLFVAGDFMNRERSVLAAEQSWLFYKQDGGGVNYTWSADDTPQLTFNDGVGAQTLAYDYRGNKSLAITFASGATPIGYADGLNVGNYTGNVTVTVNDADLVIGNTAGLIESMYNPMWAALIWNDVLTGAEMAQVHGEIMDLPGGEH